MGWLVAECGVGHYRKMILEARKSYLESQTDDPDPHLSEPLSSSSLKEKASEMLSKKGSLVSTLGPHYFVVLYSDKTARSNMRWESF